MRYLKRSELKDIKLKLLNQQEYTCPLCGRTIDENNSVVDHLHKRKTDPVVCCGAGCVRMVLCNNCNRAEGKIANLVKRFKLPKEYFSNLLWYWSRPCTDMVYPTEVPKEPKIGKREFNKLNKLYKEKTGKELEFPKSGKWTKKLKELKERYCNV